MPAAALLLPLLIGCPRGWPVPELDPGDEGGRVDLDERARARAAPARRPRVGGGGGRGCGDGRRRGRRRARDRPGPDGRLPGRQPRRDRARAGGRGAGRRGRPARAAAARRGGRGRAGARRGRGLGPRRLGRAARPEHPQRLAAPGLGRAVARRDRPAGAAVVAGGALHTPGFARGDRARGAGAVRADRDRRVPRRRRDRAGLARHPARARRGAVGHRVRAPAGGQDRRRRADRRGELRARAAPAPAGARGRARRSGPSAATGACGAASRGSGGGGGRGRRAGRVPAAAAPARRGGQRAGRGLRPVPPPPPRRRRARRRELGRPVRGRGLDPPQGDGVAGTVRVLDREGRPAKVPVEVTGARDVVVRRRLPALRRLRPRRGRRGGRRAGDRRRPALRGVAARGAGTAAATRGRGRCSSAPSARCAACDGVRELEKLSSGPGTGATTEYRLRAPDRLAWVTGRGVKSVVIGRRQWIRKPGLGWDEGEYGSGLAFKTRSWFAWSRYAREVRLLSERDGRAVLALADEGTPVWFRLTIDLATHRVVAEQMTARARFLEHPLRGLRRALRDRGARMTRSPARRALRIAGVLAAVAFVALLAYGLTTKAANSTIDDALSRGEAVAAPGFTLASLAEGRDAGDAWAKAASDGDVVAVGAARHAAGAQLLGFLVRPLPRRGEGAREGLEAAVRRRRPVPRPRRPGRPRGRARLHLPVRPDVPPCPRPGQRHPARVGRHRPARDLLHRRRRHGRRPRDRHRRRRPAARRDRGGEVGPARRRRPGRRPAAREVAAPVADRQHAVEPGDLEHALDLGPGAGDRHRDVGVGGALVRRDQQPEARGVDEVDAAEVEHELARAVGQDAVEHGLQREGGGHVEVAGQPEGDAVLAGGLVDGEVGHPDRACPVLAPANRYRLSRSECMG